MVGLDTQKIATMTSASCTSRGGPLQFCCCHRFLEYRRNPGKDLDFKGPPLYCIVTAVHHLTFLTCQGQLLLHLSHLRRPKLRKVVTRPRANGEQRQEDSPTIMMDLMEFVPAFTPVKWIPLLCGGLEEPMHVVAENMGCPVTSSS